MQIITIEPLRWLEEPSRIVISHNGDGHRSTYQVTVPRDLTDMCIGRPVEELPRILSILSPAHHLASAMALDNLFHVSPPPLAQSMREALAQSHIYIHHLKKLTFLVSSAGNPVALLQGPGARAVHTLVPHHILDEMMSGIALAQEAAGILGGRADHPLTAVAGGVSRFLKEGHYERLSEIADACLDSALQFAQFLNDKILRPGNEWDEVMSLRVPPMASIALDGINGELVLTGPTGAEAGRFSSEKALDILETSSEPWSYMPFVHLKGKDWHGPTTDHNDGLYFVGPLARLNRGQPLETDRAEEERQRLIELTGAFPHFSIMAAYRALMVELIHSAENMKELYTQDRLTGPQIRTIPSHLDHEGGAAYEAPEGFIYHRYCVDGQGIVEDVTILDASAENNALRCLLTQIVVDDAVARSKPWEAAKKMMELVFLPF
jgi:F420-non-reducing hydrogenase large subunit